ncbi:MAG: hypothetical protein HF981_01610 [Desulfobacteraceae bacterium]|nr:hypothetical protein [Desulfobacteraceae bacterium]MBC2749057.1 hypothetical protein [Desulfobacteraceae bacterium]
MKKLFIVSILSLIVVSITPSNTIAWKEYIPFSTGGKIEKYNSNNKNKFDLKIKDWSFYYENYSWWFELEYEVTNESVEPIGSVLIEFFIINPNTKTEIIKKTLQFPIYTFPTIKGTFRKKFKEIRMANDHTYDMNDLNSAIEQLGSDFGWGYKIFSYLPDEYQSTRLGGKFEADVYFGMPKNMQLKSSDKSASMNKQLVKIDNCEFLCSVPHEVKRKTAYIGNVEYEMFESAHPDEVGSFIRVECLPIQNASISKIDVKNTLQTHASNFGISQPEISLEESKMGLSGKYLGVKNIGDVPFRVWGKVIVGKKSIFTCLVCEPLEIFPSQDAVDFMSSITKLK